MTTRSAEPKRPAQLRREPLQTVAHRRRRILAPQGVDDLLRGDHPPDVQRQHGEERTQLRARDDDVAALVVEHLEPTEQPDAHGLDGTPLTGHRQREVSGESAPHRQGDDMTHLASSTPCSPSWPPVSATPPRPPTTSPERSSSRAPRPDERARSSRSPPSSSPATGHERRDWRSSTPRSSPTTPSLLVSLTRLPSGTTSTTEDHGMCHEVASSWPLKVPRSARASTSPQP